MTDTLALGYLSESTQRQRELSNEYQHDQVYKYCFCKNLCVLVLCTKLASALERVKFICQFSCHKILSMDLNLPILLEIGLLIDAEYM